MSRAVVKPRDDEELLDILEQEIYGTTNSDQLVDATSLDLENHHQCGHSPKRKDCPDCQLACGPVYRHLTHTEEERATRIIHVDLSGPHNQGWPCESVYLLVAIARLQKKDGQGFPLLPYVRCLPSKTSNDVSNAVDDIIGEIEATTIPGLAPGPRLARLHTDKGTEYLGTTMKARLFDRKIFHTTTMGYDPKANGLAERYVGLIKEQTRNLIFSSELDEQWWPWAAEHASEQARSKIITPASPLLAFGSKVSVRKLCIDGPRKGFKPRAEIGRLLVNRSSTHKEAVILTTDTDNTEILITGTAPVVITTVPWKRTRQKNAHPNPPKQFRSHGPHIPLLQESRFFGYIPPRELPSGLPRSSWMRGRILP